MVVGEGLGPGYPAGLEQYSLQGHHGGAYRYCQVGSTAELSEIHLEVNNFLNVSDVFRWT